MNFLIGSGRYVCSREPVVDIGRTEINALLFIISIIFIIIIIIIIISIIIIIMVVKLQD